MARYTESSCRLCRREGSKLFLKGDRCYTDKCAFTRRSYAPGQHGQSKKRRTKTSEYGIQLREKQKVRRVYGILETQFRRTFEKADRMKGITGENLLALLERRLDNVVFRMGMADSRNQARQMVRHGFFRVDGRRVNIPSFIVKIDEVISVCENKKDSVLTKTMGEAMAKRNNQVQWLEIDAPNMSAKVARFPSREEISLPVQEQLIVELYSR